MNSVVSMDSSVISIGKSVTHVGAGSAPYDTFMSDESIWIQEVAHGNQEALRRIYGKYASRVFNTAVSYTKNSEDAEEILQDVFVTIYNTASTFRSDASISTWIYRITVNKSLDFLRKKNSKKRLGFFTSIYKANSSEIAHESVDFVHPGVKLENQEDSKVLFKAIGDLAENQKTAFILTQIEGLSHAEASEIMNTSRKSVESLLQRAKVNLRKALEKYYPHRGNLKTNTSK